MISRVQGFRGSKVGEADSGDLRGTRASTDDVLRSLVRAEF
jgi:hypothetical protein